MPEKELRRSAEDRRWIDNQKAGWLCPARYEPVLPALACPHSLRSHPRQQPVWARCEHAREHAHKLIWCPT